jgi:hypothetical protein
MRTSDPSHAWESEAEYDPSLDEIKWTLVVRTGSQDKMEYQAMAQLVPLLYPGE